MTKLVAIGSEDEAIWIVKSSAPKGLVKGRTTSIVVKGGESKHVHARIFKFAPLISYTVKLYIVKGGDVLHSMPFSIPFAKHKEIIFDIDRSFTSFTISTVRCTWFDHILRFFGLSMLHKLFDEKRRKFEFIPSPSSLPDTSDQSMDQHLLLLSPSTESKTPIRLMDEKSVPDADEFIKPNTSSQSMGQHWLLLSPSTESKTPAQSMDEKSVPDAHFIEGESNNGYLSKSLSSNSFTSFHSCESDNEDAPNENSHEVGVESGSWKVVGLLKKIVAE